MIALPTTTTSPTPPAHPAAGDFWVNSTTNRRYVWYVMDSGQGQWVQADVPMTEGTTAYYPGIVGPVGPSEQITNPAPKITLAPQPPGSPAQGDLWWSTITGQTSVWYFDGNSYQWVIANYGGKEGPPGPPGAIGEIVAGPGLTGGGTTPQVELAIDTTVVAPLDSPVFTGVPSCPTPAANALSSTIPNIAWVANNVNASLANFAPLANPAFVGVPTAPTAAPGTNTTQLATTAFVTAAIATIPPPPTTLPPNGPAGGDLQGTYPSPTIRAAGSTGSVLTNIAGVASWSAPGSVPPSGAAGGDLAGSYPNPVIKPSVALTTPNIGAATGTSLTVTGNLYASSTNAMIQGYNVAALNSVVSNGGVQGATVTATGKIFTTGGLDSPAGLPLPLWAGGNQILSLTPNELQPLASNSVALGDPTHLFGPLFTATQAPGTSNTMAATTAFVTAAIAAIPPSSSVSVGITPPASPTANELWWRSDTGQMFIYYQDINSTQWVPASAPVTSSSAVPPGSIVDFAGAAAPSGWYFCDGSLKNRTMDAPLFAAIGTLYGAGDGSTTFGLPDLRGRVTAGADPTGLRLGNGRPGGFTGAGSAVLGAVAGEQNHTQIVAEQATMPCQSNAVGGMNYVSFQGYGAQITVVGSGPSPVYQAPIADTTAVGGGLAHNNVAPTLIVNKIIKA